MVYRKVWDFVPTYFISCNGPCAPKEKWHGKEHIVIIIISSRIIIVLLLLLVLPLFPDINECTEHRSVSKSVQNYMCQNLPACYRSSLPPCDFQPGHYAYFTVIHRHQRIHRAAFCVQMCSQLCMPGPLWCTSVLPEMVITHILPLFADINERSCVQR